MNKICCDHTNTGSHHWLWHWLIKLLLTPTELTGCIWLVPQNSARGIGLNWFPTPNPPPSARDIPSTLISLLLLSQNVLTDDIIPKNEVGQNQWGGHGYIDSLDILIYFSFLNANNRRQSYTLSLSIRFYFPWHKLKFTMLSNAIYTAMNRNIYWRLNWHIRSSQFLYIEYFSVYPIVLWFKLILFKRKGLGAA